MSARDADARDYGWAAFAAVMLLLLVGAIFGAVWDVATDQRWLSVLGVPVAGVFYWWLGVGAWRRTVWSLEASSLNHGHLWTSR